ncbi:MAG TPA: hypothetical protein VGK63_10655 [Candidatus Limnocylindrales bacterium]
MIGAFRRPGPTVLAAAGLFIVAIGYALRLVRPLSAASVGPDAIAPVTELRRLLAGQPVEGYLTQTSKPLFDLLYGTLHAVDPGWRGVALAAVLAFGLAVALGAVLAHRIGGPASGAFAAFGLLVSPALLLDVNLAYAVTWLVLLLVIAGLAVAGPRRRYGLAGVALMLAGLVRPEAIAVTLVATAVLLVVEILAATGRANRPPRRAYLVLVGFLTIPILAAHDALLFGNGLYWANAAAENSAGRNTLGLVGMIGWMVGHFLGEATLLPLAAVGLWLLGHRRQWPLLIGLVGVIFGIAALFVVSGARGTLIPARYLFPVDIGLVFASAIGISALDLPGPRGVITRWLRDSVAVAVAMLALGILVAGVVAPVGLLDKAVRDAVRANVTLHANGHRAIAVLESYLGPPPSWRGLPAGDGFADAPLVIVAPQIRQEAVADLDLPLTEVGYDWPRFVNPMKGRPMPGTLLYVDRHDQTLNRHSRVLRISTPTTIDGRRYVPLFVDQTRGIWVLRVEDATAG